MAFRIDAGVFKTFDTATSTFKERFRINNSGRLIELNADGTEKGATLTTDGGTVTGETHFTHTSNTYAGASVTVDNYYINDTNTRLHEGGGNSLRITTPTGWVQFGSENSSWAHFNTDRAAFYFNRPAEIAGSYKPYTHNAHELGSSTKRWSTIHGVAGNFSGNLTVGGTITAQEFHTEFVNQTIIQETGDVQVDGELTFTGAATTSNQSYGIVWSGFDKEGTTDFSDSAYIKHTTNTGGFSGSVLVIHSANDANDGIAFSTNASSNLKHNGNIILTAGNYTGTLDSRYKKKSDEIISPRPEVGAVPSGFPSGLYVFDSESSAPYSWPFDAGIVWGIHPSVGSNYRHLQFISSAAGDQLMMRMKDGTNDSWRGWTHLATRDWVSGQISSTSGISQATADTRYQPIGNYFTDGDTVLNMANNDGLEYNDSNNLMYVKADGANYQIIDSRGGTFTGSIIPNGGINMNNRAITRVNNLTFDDPGPNEGIAWNGGNGFSIYESPNDLTTNSAGNLQFVRSGNRLLTLTSGNNVEVPNKLLIGGANDNDGKADFAVGNSNQISWMSSQVQIGATDMNWGGKAYYSSGFHIGAWDVNLRLFTQGGANNRDIIIEPQRNGTPTEVARFKGDGHMYFPGLDLAISGVNSSHGAGNYLRGDANHLVIGTGGTLHLNYAHTSGTIHMYGTIQHSGGASIGGQYSFTKVNDHAIRVGTIRGTAVGSQTGEYIHLYNRVHIGSPSGWGSRPAPTYGLSVYGATWLATDTGAVGIGTTAPQSGYKLSIAGGVHMNNNAINYVDQLHFNNNLRFVDEGNDSYLRFKYGDTGAGGIKVLDGNDNVKGYLYGSGSGFGLLNQDGDWAVLTTATGTHLMYDGTTKLSTVSNGIQIPKTGTDSYIHFPSQTNDPGYIRHYESNNTARMYFSVSDDNNTTDYFGFGYSGDQNRFRIYANGQWDSQGSGAVNGKLTTTGPISVANRTAISVAHWGRTNNTTGAIKITLPGSHSSNWSMAVLRITTYEYNTNEHTIYYVSGHDWTTGWYNNRATKIGSSDKEIRFGHDANDDYVIVGDVGSVWSYGHVTVDLMAHPEFYSSAMDISDGWSIEQVTDLTGITLQTITNDTMATESWVTGTAKSADANKLDGYDWMQSGKSVRANEFYADNWFRNYNANEGIYNENTGQHWYSSGSDNWSMRSSASTARINLHTNGTTRRGSIYANNSNHVGILDAGGSWAIKHRNDEGTEFFTDGETKELTIGRDLVTGNYGTVQTHTTRSSWGGYSINGQYVFMSDHSNRVGIFNDVDNEWMLEATRNADLKLYHNGTVRLTTTGSGVTVNGYIQSDAPAAPAVTAANIVGDTIEVVFNASATGNIDYYQVWSSVEGGSYSLISQIPDTDFAATMTVIDSTFSVSGTIDYRVYAVKSGVYSAPGTISKTYTSPALDVVGMSVVNLNTAYYIQYDMPSSRFVDHIEIYMDAEPALGDLTRTGATLVYSGNNTSYMYQVGAADLDKYHQFWVEVVES